MVSAHVRRFSIKPTADTRVSSHLIPTYINIKEQVAPFKEL